WNPRFLIIDGCGSSLKVLTAGREIGNDQEKQGNRIGCRNPPRGYAGAQKVPPATRTRRGRVLASRAARELTVSIQHQVLGEPGRDNALLARIWSGQATHRLLFDCGEGCLSALSVAEIRAIDALFFSHLHIDHVAGFDAFLRLNFARPEAPVLIYGPAGTTRAIHHRLRGVTWNLIAGQPGEFHITDVEPDRIITTRLLT